MYEKKYTGVSRLAKEYFALLCSVQNLHGTYDTLDEDPEGTHKPTQTYTIALSGRETYHVMQRVFSAENG
jgi:hypothetical protein